MNQLPPTGGAGHCRDRHGRDQRFGRSEVTAPIAVYVHVPFCPTKCGYCDFNSFAMDGPIVEETAAAIAREIRESPIAGRPAKTVFFGGGTPTFLAVEDLIGILDAVRETHPVSEAVEVTSEANPGTVDASKFEAMRKAGFNRVSMGAQSFVDADLLRLGRVHRADEIGRAFSAARSAGFDNINLDLMFALPGQSELGWKKNLERAIALEPEHLSLYCLTIEQNTPFYLQNLRGQLEVPDEDIQVAMYQIACETMEAAGYRQYEISNFSKPGFESRHNLCYWRAEAYAGYGPGAVGFVDGVRYTNVKHPTRYRDAVCGESEIPFERESIDDETHRTEAIMLGIRLTEGIDPAALELSERSIAKVLERGWVTEDAKQGRIRLTPAGRHFCSEVALELIG